MDDTTGVSYPTSENDTTKAQTCLLLAVPGIADDADPRDADASCYQEAYATGLLTEKLRLDSDAMVLPDYECVQDLPLAFHFFLPRSTGLCPKS